MRGDPDCKHSWVWSNYVLTSNPPQRDRICSECGRVERITPIYYKHEPGFDDIYKQFHGG